MMDSKIIRLALLWKPPASKHSSLRPRSSSVLRPDYTCVASALTGDTFHVTERYNESWEAKCKSCNFVAEGRYSIGSVIGL